MHNQPEFDKIYQEYQPRIRPYLSRILGGQAAEDIAQDVFAKVSRRLDSFKGKSSFSTWIHRINTNTALDKLRSSSFNRSSEYTPLEDNATTEDRSAWTGQAEPTVGQELIRKELGDCMREFVDRLPPDYRTVLILSELEGFKNREIADILEIFLENVKIRLHRARARLKNELDVGCSFYHSEQGNLACDRKSVGILDSQK
ncbi:MAG: RNA polymerase sigma factor [Desulfobacterales bacterium]|jgi:RNA polymerase sigma-70 factor (ECF subfamily)